MTYKIAYKHCGKGCGVFNREFATDKKLSEWLKIQFPIDEYEYKLIGIIKL